MSKSKLKSDEIMRTRMRVFARSGWRCVFVDENGEQCTRQATQAAHVLPQDVLHLARYGPTVIHHIDNLRGTCPKHNASVQINYRSRPVEADEHAAAIRKKLEQEH
jgi:hypothetical protein